MPLVRQWHPAPAPCARPRPTTARTVIRLGISQQVAHNFYGGPRRYFQTFIHPDAEHMRKAAYRYDGDDYGEALGCCQPAPVRDVDYAHFAGVVRFVAGHITTEIVAHEFTHAALIIYRMDVAPNVQLGHGCRRREEKLAYIVGDLIASASNRLHAAGAWS